MTNAETTLKGLLTLFEDNTEKVKEIVSIFVRETPTILQHIEELIKDNKLDDAARLIHKVKIRYGYLGLDEIMNELNTWENELKSGVTLNPQERIHYFQQLNASVIGELNKTSKGLSQPLIFQEKCILVAEDDEVNALVFELFIKETGASVIIAKDGHEAIRYAMERKPDLIFMDVHMPVLSGYEVIREIRNQNVSCPIVSLSASTRLNEKQNSLNAGANDFLIKPVNRNAIVKTLTKFLS
ncbi:MAG: response regulator [Bacteroidetes bacterium]|nr:response regulator [Bacteroidota bacterium]